MAALTEGLYFLINTLFTLYLFVLLLRVLLPAVKADYYNPFSQVVVKLTQPLIAPLAKILPRTDRIDTAAIVVLLLFTCLKNWVLLALILHAQIAWLGLGLLGIAQILELAIQFYFFAIIIQAVISWVQPDTKNPLVAILYQLTEPLLLPARRLIPPIGGLDISPLIVLLLLQLISIMVINPLMLFALQLTVGIIR